MTDPFVLLDDAVIEQFGFECRIFGRDGSLITTVKLDVNDSFLDLMSGDVTINASEPKLSGKGIDWVTPDNEIEVAGKRYQVNREPETDVHGWSEIQVSRIYDSN